MKNVDYISRLIGLLLLALVIIILIATPGAIFSRNVSFIYPSLSDPSSGQTSVQTKMDFGDQEHVESFPMEIGEWTGINYDSAEAEKMRQQLGASVLMMRDYYKPGLWRGLTFLIMQSEDRSSFHPPQVCYPAQGWKVQEEGTEVIPMPESFWKEVGDIGPMDPLEMALEYLGPVCMSKLIITTGDDEIEDRHVVLYCYVRNSSYWGSSDTVTMLRVSGPTLLTGSSEDMLNVEKEFMAEVIPLLFEAREEEDIIISQIASLGPGGIFLLILIFAVPLIVAFHPEIRRLYYRWRQKT